MKHFKIKLIILSAVLLQNLNSFAEGIALNNDGTDVNINALQDVKRNEGIQGVFLLRMKTAQKNTLTDPAIGLMVSQTLISNYDYILLNKNCFLQFNKESGKANSLRTVSNLEFNHQLTQDIFSEGQTCTIKEDMLYGGSQHKIKDSRTDIPKTISRATDYEKNKDWLFDFILLNSDDRDLIFTAPLPLSLLPVGIRHLIFNTGSNLIFGDINTYAFDGSVEFRQIGPGAYIELQKINEFLVRIQEKNVSQRKKVLEISNIVIGPDTDQISDSDCSSIVTWTDFSGNCYDFTATNQPILQTIGQKGKR